MIDKGGNNQLSRTMLNSIRKLKEHLIRMKEAYEKETSTMRGNMLKQVGPAWFNPRNFFDETIAQVGMKRPYKKINFKVSVTNSTPL